MAEPLEIAGLLAAAWVVAAGTVAVFIGGAVRIADRREAWPRSIR